ncbi:hypothetical protein [Photobacterium sp. TY1-4]|uniref:hypothetical protein n=1 Tax=Photobacterium sp. TY1-4 TaxID=2899122 RepID=UPI0021BFBA97|nr:hypothetical protein [Photobacterium sp. TY1-4]UXI03285.1 hypothetical protein NH461_22915 [Photobacterium sp. TY1-4]
MKVLKLISLFAVMITPEVFSSDNFYFEQLNNSISKYSRKINHCDLKKKVPNLSKSQISLLKHMIEEKPLILAYLSERSFNNCLQPERGELAELLASYDYLKLPMQTKKLAESTKKMIFEKNYETDRAYLSLTPDEQKEILSITKLEQPFSEFETYEKIMGM